MLITRTSGFTGTTRTMELPITNQQYRDWENGMVIQKAIPNLTPDEREFIMTGVTKEEWDKYIK